MNDSLKQHEKLDKDSNQIPMTGFVFRENKFVSEPLHKTETQKESLLLLEETQK